MKTYELTEEPLDVYGKSHIRMDGSMHLLLTYIDASYTALMDTIRKGESE